MSSAKMTERKQMAVIGGSLAAMSAATATLSQRHPFVIWIYGAYLLAAFGYVVVQLVKIRRAQKRRKAMSTTAGREKRA
jgi:hypothetical protein